jgi:hypothetical protein
MIAARYLTFLTELPPLLDIIIAGSSSMVHTPPKQNVCPQIAFNHAGQAFSPVPEMPGSQSHVRSDRMLASCCYLDLAIV